MREPRGGISLTGVFCHITDNSTFAFNITVPFLESFVNVSLREFPLGGGSLGCGDWVLMRGFCNDCRLVLDFLRKFLFRA